jgi:hypothetical protein
VPTVQGHQPSVLPASQAIQFKMQLRGGAWLTVETPTALDVHQIYSVEFAKLDLDSNRLRTTQMENLINVRQLAIQDFFHSYRALQESNLII